MAEIRYRAKESGIVIEEMHLYENRGGRLRLTAGLRSKMGGCVSVKSFLARSAMRLERYPCLPQTAVHLSQRNAPIFCFTRIQNTAVCRESHG